MRSNHDVLQWLRGHYAPDVLAEVLRRILCVPEAWEALRVPGFPEQAVGSPDLTPAHLAAVSLGGERMTPELGEPHRGRAELLWQEAIAGLNSPRDLLDVALIATELIHRFDDPETLEKIVADADRWSSPMAVAWPALTNPESALERLLRAGGHSLAIHAVRANLPLAEAGAYLARNAGGAYLPMLATLTSDDPLLPALITVAHAPIDPIAELVNAGLSLGSAGDDLELAAGASLEHAAILADLLADTTEDPESIAAHRLQALDLAPTAERRAQLALARAALGETDAAIAALKDSPPERIVRALIAADGAGRDLSSDLKRAAPHWAGKLADRLAMVGEVEPALAAASRAAAHAPASRARYAEMLLSAGDVDTGLAEAELAAAMAPHSAPLQRALVDLAITGRRPALALQYMETLDSIPQVVRARAALEAGDVAQAQNVAAELLDTEPHDVEAHLILARVHTLQGDAHSARVQIDEALRLKPQSTEAHRALASWLMDQGNEQEAGETLAHAAQLAPESAQTHADYARWLLAQGRLQEALAPAQRAADADPGSYALPLARAQLALGHVDQAAAILHTAEREQPRNWEVKIALAETFERKSEIERAAAKIAGLPHSAEVRGHLVAGRIHAQAGDPVAIEHLERARRLGSSDPTLDYWLGVAFEGAGEPEVARDRYQRALETLRAEHTDEREQSTLGIARTALELDDISGALDVLQRAQNEDRASSKVLSQISVVYSAAGLNDRAVEAARRAIDADQREPAAWKALGGALAAAGDYNAASQAIDELGRLAPGSTRGWIDLARMASEAGARQSARRALAGALMSGRADPDVVGQTALIAADSQMPDTARRLAARAVALRPEQASLHAVQARVYEAIGDQAAACEAWVASADRAPSDPQLLINAAHATPERKTAIALLERALVVDPLNQRVRRELADGYLDRGDYSRGVEAYASLVREDSTLSLEAAEAMLLAGLGAQALPFIEGATASISDEGRLEALRGEALLLVDRRTEAEQALTRAVEADYMSTRLLAMLAIAALRGSDAAAAGEALDRAMGAGAHTVADAIWIARALVEFGRWEQVMQALSDWREPAAEFERVRLALRVRDAAWLYSQFEADVAGPDEARWTGVVQDAISGLQAERLRFDDPDRVVIEWLQVGDAKKALQILTNTPQPTPWSALLMGLACEMLEDDESARTAFGDASPATPLAEFALGRAFQRAGRPKRAAQHLGGALAAWPDEHRWQARLGDVYLELDEPDAALAHYQAAVLSEPEQPEYQLRLARIYRQCGHLGQSVEAYRSALQSGAEDAETLAEAGEVALDAGAMEQAMEWFETASKLAPNAVRVHVGAAMANASGGRQNVARDHLNAAKRIAPDSPDVWLGEARLLAEGSNPVGALRALDQALAAGAKPLDVFRLRGNLLLEQGKPQQAIEALERALQQAPDSHLLWSDLAGAHEAAGDFKAADRAISQALRIAPLNPDFQVALARIARRGGNLDRALDVLSKAAEAVPSDPRVPVEIGLVFEERREYSRALDAYREAIRLDAANLEAYYRAGLLLRSLKAYQKAGEMLKQAASLAPINKDVMHQLAAVRALELVHG